MLLLLCFLAPRVVFLDSFSMLVFCSHCVRRLVFLGVTLCSTVPFFCVCSVGVSGKPPVFSRHGSFIMTLRNKAAPRRLLQSRGSFLTREFLSQGVLSRRRAVPGGEAPLWRLRAALLPTGRDRRASSPASVPPRQCSQVLPSHRVPLRHASPRAETPLS